MEDMQKEKKNENIYIIKLMKNFSVYNNDNLVNKNEDLICPICFYILKYPINCSDKNNSHSFCKECIDIYLKESNKCPICKNNFE